MIVNLANYQNIFNLVLKFKTFISKALEAQALIV